MRSRKDICKKKNNKNKIKNLSYVGKRGSHFNEDKISYLALKHLILWLKTYSLSGTFDIKINKNQRDRILISLTYGQRGGSCVPTKGFPEIGIGITMAFN